MVIGLVAWKMEKEDVNWYLGGKEVILKEIPVLKNKNKGVSLVSADDILRAKQTHMVKENGLGSDFQLPILVLLEAEVPTLHPTQANVKIDGSKLAVQEGELQQSRRIHKMLFDLWQRSIPLGYETAYPHDTFKKEVFGPVAEHLKSDLKFLEENEYITAMWEKGHECPTVIKLTEKGKTEAGRIWTNTPEDIRKIAIETKDFFVLKSIGEIVDYFHKKYPEYRKMEVPKDE